MQTIIAKKEEDAAKLHDKATVLLQEAEAKILQAENISQSLHLVKRISKKEEALIEEKNKLGEMVLEYNEKLNKLRSVMA